MAPAMKLSPTVADLSLSVTLALDARAKELARERDDIVNMAVGEPDFPAPAACLEAAERRLRSGHVKYTPAAGTPSLRATIARYVTETRGVPYEAADIVVCHSAKHALSGAILALLGAGDEMLIPLPAWVSYFEMVKIAGATPVLVPPRPDYRPDLEAIERAIGPRTRALLLCSPSNPSGYVLDADELRALTDLARRHDLWILSDEIYRRLVYEGPPAGSPVAAGADLRERVAIVDGASKCFAMTGFRIGFLCGPRPLISAVTNLHSQMTGSPNAVSQDAYEAALVEEPPEVATMVRAFAERRGVLVDGLRALGLSLPEPRGAFYAFPDVGAYLDERGSVGFCADLLEDRGLALVPGAAFGMDRHVRLSYATSLANIREALARLGEFLKR